MLLDNQAAGNYTVQIDTSRIIGEACMCVNTSYTEDPEKWKPACGREPPPALSLGINCDAINEATFL